MFSHYLLIFITVFFTVAARREAAGTDRRFALSTCELRTLAVRRSNAEGTFGAGEKHSATGKD